jgi:uncharacterized membrane protein (DUF4010 family)
LSGLLGGISAALSQILNTPLILGISFAVFGAVFAWFSYRETEEEKTFSVTATVAALVVFALGALAIVGEPLTAAAVGAATAGLLASREVLHEFLQKLSWAELRSALLLLAMTVIVLPILPDKPISPYDTLSPQDMWMLTVLTAGISFAGYLATKILGDAKGTLLTSIAGGLVSSTAVTIDFARRARSGEATRILAAGAMLAGIISILRVLVIVLVVAPDLVGQIIIPALVAAATLAIYALFYWTRGTEAGQPQMTFRNPFDLQPLLVFALTLLVASLISGWLVAKFGIGGIMVSSASVALVDVDIAVLTASHFSHTAIGAGEAATAILLALAVNALARVSYSIFTGPRTFFASLAVATLSAIAAGTVSLLAMP